MPSLTIAWEYLTGYAVATDPSRRERAEWPPHPGRIFMAMAAAWFETGEEQAEGAALRWLETLGDPELCLPSRDHVFERSLVTVYVPVNDRAGPAAATLQSAPAITRSKQPRTFPRIWVGYESCCMTWRDAEAIERHREALDRLCGKVTRIGHSSSLVRMWAADAEPAVSKATETWMADDLWVDHYCRVMTPGLLDSLPAQTGIPHIRRYAEFHHRICQSAGKEQKQAKAEYEKEFGEKWKKRWQKEPSPPALGRPRLGISKGYRVKALAQTDTEPEHGLFGTDMLVLTREAGPSLPLVSTLAVTRALRGAVMSMSPVQPSPSWASGHEPDGQPLRSDDDGHLACIPLPYVGREHADGHLLGVGLVFPRSVDRRERSRVLGPVLIDPATREPRSVRLCLGRIGVWTVQKCAWDEPRESLAEKTWTAHPDGADTWASVTPVVLDRFPKTDRAKDRLAWTDEVAEIIVTACARIGMPAPVNVDIDTTSWHRGSPRSTTKRRPLRARAGTPGHRDASLGDGFPPLPPKGTNAPRPQTHVWLRFAEPVVGPILLGAGRHQGYGLCKPLGRDRS